MFIKSAAVKVIGVSKFARGRREAAINPFGLTETKFSDILSTYSKLYKVASNPFQYVFAVCRAITADVPNENKDCFGEYEVLSAKNDGRFTYETFNFVPLLEEHRDEDITTAGGIIIDAYYDDAERRDKRVMTLVAVDTKKKQALANDLLKGVVQGFSMGCVCEQSRCSICGNVAKVAWEFCSHVANKFLLDKVGGKKVFEYCEGVVFKELSHVSQPADTKALSSEVCNLHPKGELQCKSF